jgi:hypothetical protein
MKITFLGILSWLRIIVKTFGALTTAAVAQGGTDDPTFNGLANMIHCNLRTATLCSGNYCSDLSGYEAGNLWISLATHQISSGFPMGRAPAAPAFPIEITEVSTAAFNSILHVEFKYPAPGDGGDRSGLLLFVPKNNGGYDVHFGGTGIFSDPEKRIGSLALSRSTIGGSCEIINQP